MRAIVIGSTKHFLFALGYGLLGILAAALFGAVWTLNDRPELKPWHTLELKNEYHQQLGLKDFSEYLQLEQSLFSELDTQIQRIDFASNPQHSDFNRYDNQSPSSPLRFDHNWNRSYEWQHPDAEFGVLLLHGMSDSPYALSHFAKHFSAKAHVLSLRLPGHGTLPSGLTSITWPDLASAVSLATAHMKLQLKGKPLYVIGFSTGAALALNHELENIDQDKTTDYQAMVMLSPAIGLKPIAAFAKWQAYLGQILGQKKLIWNSIETEYDPFKYQSFAVNAGDVVYQLSQRNKQLMHQLTATQKRLLGSILSFQSVVDDTVSSQEVLTELYQQLGLSQVEPSKPTLNMAVFEIPVKDVPSQAHHELVLFDVNRNPQYRQWLALPLDELMFTQGNVPNSSQADFTLTLIENNPNAQDKIQARVMRQGTAESLLKSKTEPLIESIALQWPKGVYSLSHIALPYPESDELYGRSPSGKQDKIHIGGNIHSGERGVIALSASDMLRQKWNPFYPYVLQRVDDFFTVK
ncbi:carboxylesterase [Shewanella sp. SR44-3]|uniref:alpha/beta hydrolase n=1 Tax=Shewanella sp. SR44-3 TaxID=2760936 RepID=UPI0015FE5CBE|nr:alpha/beta fold hydrolase [Shewanella sp. SR44-3]MBB1268034.1 alpha/beta fold hydrolase [Shewanella sp. SR44-3]